MSSAAGGRPEPVLITLTSGRMEWAVRMGRVWQKIAGGRNLFDVDHGADDRKRRVEAAGARLALAQHFGGTIPLGVNPHYSALPDADLVPQSGDGSWWLVTGRRPNYELVGWIWGSEREQRGVYRDDVAYPGWFVSRTRLRDVRTFTGEEDGGR